MHSYLFGALRKHFVLFTCMKNKVLDKKIYESGLVGRERLSFKVSNVLTQEDWSGNYWFPFNFHAIKTVFTILFLQILFLQTFIFYRESFLQACKTRIYSNVFFLISLEWVFWNTYYFILTKKHPISLHHPTATKLRRVHRFPRLRGDPYYCFFYFISP